MQVCNTLSCRHKVKSLELAWTIYLHIHIGITIQGCGSCPWKNQKYSNRTVEYSNSTQSSQRSSLWKQIFTARAYKNPYTNFNTTLYTLQTTFSTPSQWIITSYTYVVRITANKAQFELNKSYCMIQNFGGRKFWRIWTNSPKFSCPIFHFTN